MSGRCTSCVASSGAVGVYCHRCPLTAGVSRVARAPALIPLCARLRTAVPETEGLNFANERCGPGGGSGVEVVGRGDAINLQVLQKGDVVTRLFGTA